MPTAVAASKKGRPHPEDNPVTLMTADARKALAKRLVGELITNHGMTTEAIAVELDVNNHTVIRWRDGERAPQPGAMKRLQQLHTDKSKK